ncbi:MAG: beta-ketoacyl-[acyl-carrier-protein] synthase family protein [Verrucomicrobiae bacterium]|nr:beta-ketoacyl-[acyl-carrier-protein] synthase family protein [Verrucomicrobiae bacterium]
MRRVVVTGMGVISALGRGREAFREGLRVGRCGIGPWQGSLGEGLRMAVGAQVTGFDPATIFQRGPLNVMDRFAQFGVWAAREACEQAGLKGGGAWQETAGVVMGTCVGGQQSTDDGYAALYREGKAAISPFTVPRVMGNAAASQISMEFGLRGPSFSVASACASSNHALGLALHLVRSGLGEVMMAGGSEAPLVYGHLKAWEALRVVAPEVCRPFCAERRGMVLGEGAAVLVLESLDHARRRGATVLGELAGAGMSSDAGHITQPSVEGASVAMERALADAGLTPDDIDYINAHGTGTKVNDVTESRAIGRVFGERARTIPVSSTKSMHGHTLGAAGAIEAVATLLALGDGFVPPTMGFVRADPECPLDVVPNRSRPARLRAAMSNGFAFGGLNAVLVFRRLPAEDGGG